MPLIVAEENPENFYPLTLKRATFELRYGAWCPLDRALLITPDVALRCRPELAEYVRAKTGLPVNEDIEGELFPGLPAARPWDILAQSDRLISADFEPWARRHRNTRKSREMVSGGRIGNETSGVGPAGCTSAVLALAARCGGAAKRKVPNRARRDAI